jgi:hypothetical protein
VRNHRSVRAVPASADRDELLRKFHGLLATRLSLLW